MLKYIFWGKGVKEVGWRFFDSFSYLSSSCCLSFSSVWSIVLLLLPSSVVFLLSGVATAIWQDRRSMQGCLGKIFLFSNGVTSYPLPRVYGVCKIADFYSNSLATAQTLPSVQLSMIIFFLCSTLRLEHSCRCITFATPDNGFFFIMSSLDFSINFHPSWIFQRRCSEH